MSHLHHKGSQHELLELHVKKEVVSPMDTVEAETTKSIIDAFLTQGQVIATTELEEELDLTQAEPLNHLNNARAELASLVATAFEAVHDNTEVQNVAEVMTHDLAECVCAAPQQCTTSAVPDVLVTLKGKPAGEEGESCRMGNGVRHHPTMEAGLSPRTDNEVPLPPAISPDIQPKSFYANQEIPRVDPQVMPVPDKKMDQLNSTVSCSLVNNSESDGSPKLRRFSDSSPYRRRR
ncbi:hypothetical protein RvY_04527 [Ramazzottius varieornatus]|uniref:Uncharacterized protein n=1 Tax=Ramazzottius varieornatus TaxID=947166 RepID=A0A1D1URW6_RAMVA|nr:hypothetical protein RvY_04527 [Ramazzottius varieornatus]